MHFSGREDSTFLCQISKHFVSFLSIQFESNVIASGIQSISEVSVDVDDIAMIFRRFSPPICINQLWKKANIKWWHIFLGRFSVNGNSSGG